MPLSDQSIVQVATGSTGGTDASTTFVTFPTPAQAGNTVLMVLATSFTSITDSVIAETLTHPLPVELAQFENSPSLKPNTPVLSDWGAYLDADTASWEFDWVRVSDRAAQVTGVAWMAVEVAGMVPLFSGGRFIPFEVNGSAIWWYEGGATVVADTVDGSQSPSVVEAFVLAGFAAWVPSSRPPAVTSFTESTDTTWGGWTPLASNVRTTNASTPNVGLDVAYKIVYGGGTFNCHAAYGQAPGGIGVIKTVFASDYLGPQRVRSSLTAQVMSG